MNNQLITLTLRNLNHNCNQCYLRNTDSKPVATLAKGRIFVVGNNPGFDEDLTGEPFSGREGQFFRKFFSEIFNPDEIHYTYLIKCFPNSQKVKQSCRMTCANLWLTKEIEYADPDVIICCAAPIYKILTSQKHSEIPTSEVRDSRAIILIEGIQKLNKRKVYDKNLRFIKKILEL